MDKLQRLLREQSGQDLVEYSLLIVFVLVAAAMVLGQTGSSIVPIWTTGNSIVQDAATTTS
jgi:Flp pilus assembly pilin Flp